MWLGSLTKDARAFSGDGAVVFRRLHPHDEAAWLVTTAFNLVMNHRMHRLDEGLSMFEACKKMILGPLG